MKTIALLLAMLLGSLMFGQTKASGQITAIVPNVNGTEGEVLFALYTADSFMKRDADYSAMSTIENGKAVGVFQNVPKGTYAVVVLHDRNSNKRMDLEPSGMPQEDYGTSGNSMSFGPPNWMESKFDFDGTQKEIEIRF